jgi:hypothetical protein
MPCRKSSLGELAIQETMNGFAMPSSVEIERRAIAAGRQFSQIRFPSEI